MEPPERDGDIPPDGGGKGASWARGSERGLLVGRGEEFGISALASVSATLRNHLEGEWARCRNHSAMRSIVC